MHCTARFFFWLTVLSIHLYVTINKAIIIHGFDIINDAYLIKNIKKSTIVDNIDDVISVNIIDL